jgi:hypothetical protein
MGESQDYRFRSSLDGHGEIQKLHGDCSWRFESVAWRKSPLFVVRDEDDREIVTINRVSFLPMARFDVVQGGLSVGRIRQRSPLFTKYSIELDSGSLWTLHLPLFTVYFTGSSGTGERLMVRVWSLQGWDVRITAVDDEVQILAAVAYIVRKRVQLT